MTVHRQAWLVVAIAISLLHHGRLDAVEAAEGEIPAPAKKATDLKFNHASFTFVRIKYANRTTGPVRGAPGNRWATDYPNSDRNLSTRFAIDTGMKTDPGGKVLALTDPELKQYPFIYIVEPGSIQLSDREARRLREYLLGGGFLMVDDFWGETEWKNFHENIKRVFPDREPKELPLDHPVFNCFYDIRSKPQVPSIHAWLAGLNAERVGSQEAHYRGIVDDSGRLMVIICHNTDLGDGWERADESPEYFREVSQKKAYPLGVNILVYALTH